MGRNGSSRLDLELLPPALQDQFQISRHLQVLSRDVSRFAGIAEEIGKHFFVADLTIVPKGKSSEFFGFHSISGKFGNIVGPLMFAVVSQLAGIRLSILSLIVFLVGGMLSLSRVDTEEGRRAARAADGELLQA